MAGSRGRLPAGKIGCVQRLKHLVCFVLSPTLSPDIPLLPDLCFLGIRRSLLCRTSAERVLHKIEPDHTGGEGNYNILPCVQGGDKGSELL